MSKWKTIPGDAVLQKTIEALKKNGIDAIIVQNSKEAKDKVLELLPKGAEVMNMTSVTHDMLGLTKEIMESGYYIPVKKKLSEMSRETHHHEMQKMGSAPLWTVGSIHAVTHQGQVLVASNTGSQLAAYVYGSPHVIWVVGAQKVVKDINEGMNRIYEHILPLESKRARKAYGLPDTWNSNVSKVLIINKEVNPTRIKMILVKEELGF